MPNPSFTPPPPHRLKAYTTAKVGDIWYRIEDNWRRSYDEDNEASGPAYLELYTSRWNIVRRTAKGVQLGGTALSSQFSAGTKFLADSWARRYASPTLEMAYEDLLERRKAQEARYVHHIIRNNELRRRVKDAIRRLPSDLDQTRADLFDSPKLPVDHPKIFG